MISQICQDQPLYFDRVDPYFDTPHKISLSGINAIKSGKTHYGNPKGIVPLKQAVNQILLKELEVEYDPYNEILITDGSSSAIFITLVALTSPCDEILVHQPYWQSYIKMITLLNRKAVFYSIPFGRNEFSPDTWYNELRSKINLNIRIIIVNFPLICFQKFLNLVLKAKNYQN